MRTMVLVVYTAIALPVDRTVLAQVVADGGFEQGTPNPFWDESSTNFGSPICSAQTCTDFFGDAFEGQWWAWFGGAANLEIGSLAQQVTIPNGTALLSFWLDITAASGNGVDFLTVSLDGIGIFTVIENQMGEYHPWVEVTVDITPFADGGAHLLRFDSTTTGPFRSNFYVDAVEITVEAALPGDFDGDGDVDLNDFEQFDACLTGPGGGAQPPCDAFDFDADNDVDFADFQAFQIAFTGPAP